MDVHRSVSGADMMPTLAEYAKDPEYYGGERHDPSYPERPSE